MYNLNVSQEVEKNNIENFRKESELVDHKRILAPWRR